MTQRIYLAGPDVFFENPLGIADNKKKLCHKYGFEGVFPLDVEIDPENKLPLFEKAREISLSNETLMQSCDLLIANLTPFRGVSMDAGTAYEVGYMRALGKLVFGFTNINATYEERVTSYYKSQSNNILDPDRPGTEIESFNLAENLMIEIAITESGGEVIRETVSEGQEFKSLSGFEKCLMQIQDVLSDAK